MPFSRLYILKDKWEGEEIRLPSEADYYTDDVYEFLMKNNKGKYIYRYTGSTGLSE